MAHVIFELSACVDCLMFVANGEVPDARPNLATEIGGHLGLQTMQHLVCSGGEDDGEEFSWSACECCGSPLGGSRHHLAVLQSD